MSGSNDPNERDDQGGHQQGGHNQGGQPQQGGQGNYQQQQGNYQQQQGNYQQGGQQQYGGGGSSALDQLQRPEPMRYIKGIVGTMVAASLLLGVLVFLLGSVGGFPVKPPALDTATEMASMGTGASADQINSAVSNTHKTLLGYLTAEIAPFITFIMAPFFGALVGFRMSGDGKTKQLAAGAGTFVGALAFVVIVTFIGSMIIPDATAFTQAAQGATGATAGGLGGAEQLGISTSLGSVDFGNLLINGVLIGLLSGVAAAAAVFSIDNFTASA